MSNLNILEANSTKIENSSKKIRSYVDEILDKQSFVETDVFMSGKSFIDGSDALGEGVITGYGAINGYNVCIVAHNSEVLSGSLSKAQADKITKCIDRAIKFSLPLVSIIDSNGARIGEGISVLEGYASIIAAVTALKEQCTHIAIIKGNAVGLMSAYATLADFVFVGDNSVISLNAPMSVTAKANLTAKATDVLGAKKHIANNLMSTFSYKTTQDILDGISNIFQYFLSETTDSEDDVNRTSDILDTNCTARNLVTALADDGKYVELYKDYATDIITAVTSIGAMPVAIISTNANGTNAKLDRMQIKKIKRMVKLSNSFSLPLINLVDCEGITESLLEEQNGLAMSAAKLMSKIYAYEANKISVIFNKAIGFGYTALCSKSLGYDTVLAFANAHISAVNAEVAVSVNYIDDIKSSADPDGTRTKLIAKYEQEEANPFVAAKDGYIDNIIEPALIRPYIASVLGIALR